jgi:hypothetical protein
MSSDDPFRPQSLREFTRTEIANARDDVWNALIGEAWFGRAHYSSHHSEAKSLGWELRDGDHPVGASRHGDQPGEQERSAPSADHPRELDFDR